MTSSEKLIRIRKDAAKLKLLATNRTISEVKEDGRYKGLALCHTKEHRPLSERFPSLPENIDWTYVNIKGKEDKDLIIANIYDTDLQKKLSKEQRLYDYIVMPSCTVGSPPTRFRCIFPLLAMAPFLKKKGQLINNNFYVFFLDLLLSEDKEFYDNVIKADIKVVNLKMAKAIANHKNLQDYVNKQIESVVMTCGYESYRVDEINGRYYITLTK